MAMSAKNNLKNRLQEITSVLTAKYGPQKCCLMHDTPFQLLAATILSAQCTDKMVNSITPELFRKYPDAESFAAANIADVEILIHPCGFYHAKAEHIIQASQIIVSQYHGEMPHDMKSLTSLPGVGRKTANVVLGDAFGIPGLPVDTHVKRLTNLIGLVNTNDPEQIESILCKNLPEKDWAQFSHLIIIHGRTRCPARKPDCQNCEIKNLCKHGIADNRKNKRDSK